MSDDEFQKGESNASMCYPEAGGSLKKGAYAMLKDHPCKITEVSTSKAGKHGHAKASVVGIDIFTNKKYEDAFPTSHNVDVPFVKKREYSVIDVQGDDYLVLLNEDGSTKEDLKLPDTEDDLQLSEDIRKMFAEGKDILVSVLSAMGQEKVVGVREAQP